MSNLPKLGCLPRLKGFNAPKLGPAIAAAVTLPPTPPASVNWYSAVGNSFAMDGNNTVGDCTIAAQAHLIQAWTTDAGKPFAPSQADCLAKYAALSGWDGGRTVRRGIIDVGGEGAGSFRQRGRTSGGVVSGACRYPGQKSPTTRWFVLL